MQIHTSKRKRCRLGTLFVGFSNI